MIELQCFAATQPGPDLVFIHGWGSDRSVWQALRRHLPGSHWLLELPGHGTTPVGDAQAVHSYLAEVAAALPDRCVLVGWSLGGTLAMQLTHLCSAKIAGLITIASNPCFVVRADWPTAMSEETFRRFSADFAESPALAFRRFQGLQVKGDWQQKSLSQQMRTTLLPSEETLSQLRVTLGWLAELDARPALRDLKVPSLHLLGAADALVPTEVAHTFEANALARVDVIDEAGHTLPTAWVSRLAADIGDWLQSHEFCGIPSKAIAGSFAGAAERYERSARVQTEIAQHLLDLAVQTVHSGGLGIDLGCGTGYVAQQIEQRNIGFKRFVNIDIAPAMVLRARENLAPHADHHDWLVADAACLPVETGTVDVVFSSLMLQWCFRSDLVLHEISRVLAPGGWAALATLGPKTLHELKTAWSTLDSYAHVNQFKNRARLEDETQVAGLDAFFIEERCHTLRYPELLPLLKDLKNIGAHNLNAGRNRGLTSRARLQQLIAAYERFRDQDGQVSATYDVIYLILKKPHG